MTDQQHPITPPPELVEQWRSQAPAQFGLPRETFLATQAAQWGADQELEACCEWVSNNCPYFGDFPLPEDKLRTARRPKPPSLKEQAQAELDRLIALIPSNGALAMAEPIRRALEQLPND